MTSIIKVEGIGKAYTEKLKGAGIFTVEGLLKQCSAEKGRRELAAKGGIDADLILRWTNHADLFRIKGIGEEYSQLLEAVGVDTVPELAQRVPANLLAKLTEANKQKKLVRRLPVLSQVEGWVTQAKQLPRIITY
jgi:predicted flap endonuclease-1-like 5' DNA nuclease